MITVNPIVEVSSAVPNPTAITELATAYWKSMVLLAANKLRVFRALADGPLTADETAQKCGTHRRSMEMLLNACVAHDLLERNASRYANSPLARAFLVEGTPSFLGDALKYSEDLYPLWGNLAEAVRTNTPPASPQTILGADTEKTRNFVLAMHNRAKGIARSLAANLDLNNRRRLLDVGGGPGTYSILLVSQTPSLRAIVLDLPPVVAISREIIAESGYADRIDTVGGDYTTTDFGTGNDVVLMSGMLHRETPETCRSLLTKAFDSLVPGGLLVASDVFFETETKDGPPFATLFALTMMLSSENGAAHAKTEVADWIREAGFGDLEVRPLPPPMPHSMILATKPTGR